MFCAGGYTDTDTSDTCQGDSGSPLFVMLGQSALQLGITSFGGSETVNCGSPGSPGVYANISELYGFIQEHVPTANVLILPLVKVGPDTFNVRLKHLGDYNFVVETADAP